MAPQSSQLETSSQPFGRKRAAEPPLEWTSAGIAAYLNRSQPASGRARVDAATIPFSVLFEFQGGSNAINRALTKYPQWGATPIVGGDCSHGSTWNDCGYQSYTRVASPTLTLADGALEQIEGVLSELRKAGASPGKTGALRIYLSRDTLGGDTAAFMKLHSANEDILYRLGQEGGEGRSMEHKERYAISAARYATQANPHAYLSSHSYGVNASQAGKWELRYFDSTLEARPVQTNLAVLLGMVKAAKEGRVPSSEMKVFQADRHYDDKKTASRWDKFIQLSVGPGALAAQVETQFKKSGGHIKGHGWLVSHARAFVNRIGGALGLL